MASIYQGYQGTVSIGDTNAGPATVVIDYSSDEITYDSDEASLKEKTVKKGRKHKARTAILMGRIAGAASVIEKEQQRRRRERHPGQVPKSLAWRIGKAHARRRPQQGKREE